MNRKIILITGGAKSGKSSFAMAEASRINGKRAYIATAEALDEEMKERIENHKRKRGDDWVTYEEPLKITEVIKKIEGKYKAIVIDCLTLWLSNIMYSGLEITDVIDDFIDILTDVGTNLAVPQNNKTLNKRAWADTVPALFIVSNEVSMGIVPDNEIARKFRDMAGILNQRIAEVADEVYMIVAGIPMKIKGKYVL